MDEQKKRRRPSPAKRKKALVAVPGRRVVTYAITANLQGEAYKTMHVSLPREPWIPASWDGNA